MEIYYCSMLVVVWILLSFILSPIIRKKITKNKRHQCKHCSYVYPPMKDIKWVADFRTGFHKNPQTKETCYWMLFKDGTQTHDYPWE